MLRGLITFARKVISIVVKTLFNTVKDAVVNAPATTVMVFATIGIAPFIGKYSLLIPALFFIDSTLLIPVLSATAIISLAWLAGATTKRRIYVL
jgi:hypothetical protein